MIWVLYMNILFKVVFLLIKKLYMIKREFNLDSGIDLIVVKFL